MQDPKHQYVITHTCSHLTENRSQKHKDRILGSLLETPFYEHIYTDRPKLNPECGTQWNSIPLQTSLHWLQISAPGKSLCISQSNRVFCLWQRSHTCRDAFKVNKQRLYWFARAEEGLTVAAEQMLWACVRSSCVITVSARRGTLKFRTAGLNCNCTPQVLDGDEFIFFLRRSFLSFNTSSH